jgi:hypothetical protein
MDLLQTGADATKALDEAAKRYNLTIEEMGPAMQRQELDKQAIQLIQDWKLLTASGVDVAVVESKMGANMSDFVKTSLDAGQAIPEAMKPMLEQMADAGDLLDANGNAYTRAEVDGLSYTQTMSEMFSTLIDKIDRMVSALLGIPSNVSTTITTHHQDVYPDDRAGDQDATPMALGGIINAASGVVVPHRPRVGTLVRMGEGGSSEVAVPVKVLFGKFGDDIASKVAGRSDEAVRAEIAGLRADLASLDKLLARSVTSAILKGIA